jgi:hypothetical protein
MAYILIEYKRQNKEKKMKKRGLLLVVSAAFIFVFLSGCEILSYDITLLNGLERPVEVNITTSKNTPSLWYSLGRNESKVFFDIDKNDTQYVHMRIDNVTYYVKVNFLNSGTWTIKRDDKGGYILF